MGEVKKRQRLVVIGGGMAGTACVEEIVRLDPERFEITVAGAEPHPNYNRVLLSSVLTGEKTLGDLTLHDDGWYKENGIRLLRGFRVGSINRASRTLIGEDGTLLGYDRLIFATGALPVIPALPGASLQGVLAFRSIDDCGRIRSMAGHEKKAVVIGGGLLGLEAAHALKTLGMDVTIIHIMGALMEKQCDAVAAGFLRADVEALGIKVMLGREVSEFLGEERLTGVRFKDGEEIEADLAVISIGIRPNKALAEVSGVYCNRGIVVSDVMQTYDPSIYAVGECVEHRGATFGLVAPIFEQAKVVASHLAGDCRLVFVNRPTSARLKVPSIDFYSAGDVAGVSGETIEYIDRSAQVYKKVVLRHGRVAGILMYGDTASGPELFSRMISGEDVSHKRHALLFPEMQGSGQAASIELMPDETIVCGCNGVTKGMIREAIEKKGLFTREAVKKETKASGSCGGCASVVDRILEATLGASFQGGSGAGAICACTKYAREDVIKNIREKKLLSVASVMETLGWETVGCDTCRPAINYYLLMVWPLEAEDDTSSRLVNERMHANIQKDGTFSVVPRMYGGATTAAELKKIAEIAESYGVGLVKVTGGQRIDLLGVKKDDLPGMWRDLGMNSGFAYAKALRTVKTCVGSQWCRYGTQDSLGLGIELEKMLEGLWMPAKVKMSVSGCPRNCSEAGIKDIGVVGINGGWEIYAGGCAGIELKKAERIATVKTSEEVKAVCGAFIQHYREEAEYGERTFRWVSRVGAGAVMQTVALDSKSADGLIERLLQARSAVKEPWMPRCAPSAG